MADRAVMADGAPFGASDARGVEHFDVLIVGAGLSGIGAAYHLQVECPRKSYLILEGRNGDGAYARRQLILLDRLVAFAEAGNEDEHSKKRGCAPDSLDERHLFLRSGNSQVRIRTGTADDMNQSRAMSNCLS